MWYICNKFIEMGIQKVVHLADIHIRTYRMHSDYEAMFKELYSKCREITQGFEYDEVRIVIVGDLVHQKITISNELLVMTSEFISELAKIAPLVIVAGNHDLLENNKDRLDSISPMVHLLKDPNITYYKESECYLDDNIVWCNYSIFNECERPDIETARALHGDKKYIGLYHSQVLGATTDLGYEFETGTPIDHFNGCDAVMMGDVHKRQTFILNGAKIAYCGSLLQQDFGENVSSHGLLFWDIETLDFEEVNLHNDYGFYKFTVNAVDDLEHDKEIFNNP